MTSTFTNKWIVLSGKMGSGKDTLAPLIFPHEPTHHKRYSDSIRQQLQDILTILTYQNIRPMVNHYAWILQHKFDIPRLAGYNLLMEIERVIVRQEYPEIKNAWAPEWRTALQLLGSDCHPSHYWSAKVSQECRDSLQDGFNIVLTGGRYKPDVIIPQSQGAIIIRIDADEDVRERRIFMRDNILPTQEQLNHPGETALDDWDGYDIRVDNNYSIEETVRTIQERLSCLQ